MDSSHQITDNNYNSNIQFLQDFITINRIPETIGYNLAYLLIAIGLENKLMDVGSVISNWRILVVGFFGVMFLKMQASIADAIHDHDLDQENPKKSRIPAAVDRIGVSFSHTLFVMELIATLVLWGWVAVMTQSMLVLCLGAVISGIGFIYTYPPRLKEKGIFNHVSTTSVDIGCVVFLFSLLGGEIVDIEGYAFLSVVFLYIFAYHVAHQAADTYYDRKYGISTFTQAIGVTNSMLLAAVLTAVASVVSVYYISFLTGTVLLFSTLGYSCICIHVRGVREKIQSDRVSRWFSIGLWATIQNSAVAIDLLLS